MKLFHVVLAAAVLYMIQVGVEAEESAAETGPAFCRLRTRTGTPTLIAEAADSTAIAIT